jgi:hypothetical protein
LSLKNQKSLLVFLSDVQGLFFALSPAFEPVKNPIQLKTYLRQINTFSFAVFRGIFTDVLAGILRYKISILCSRIRAPKILYLMTYKEILNKLLEAKLKSGKPLVSKPEQIKAIETIRDFNPATDWIEGKDLTKMVKTITSLLYKVFPITPDDYPEYKGNEIRAYKTDDLNYALQPVYKSDHDSVATKKVADKIDAARLELMPLLDHYKLMDKRRMRNGELPKADREKAEREKIKGDLNPQLRTELERLKEKWYAVVYDYQKNWMEDQRRKAISYMKEKGSIKPQVDFPRKIEHWTDQHKAAHSHIVTLDNFYSYGVIKHGTKAEGYIPVTDEDIEKDSKRQARDESESWFFKMVDKLGGLVMDFKKELKEVVDGSGITGRGKSPFDAWFSFRFTDGSRFILQNSIVFARSSLGKPFYRYPATFHDAYISTGEKVANPDEYTVKKAFMKDAGMETMPESARKKPSKTYYQYNLNIKDQYGNAVEQLVVYTRTNYLSNQQILNIAKEKGFLKTKIRPLKFSGHMWMRRGDMPENNSVENAYEVLEAFNKRLEDKKNPPTAEDGILMPTGKEVVKDQLPDYEKEVGGYLAGVNEDGNIVIHEDGDQGGMLLGKRHAEDGGIQGYNTSTNSKIFVETGEASINSKAVLDKTKHEFDGKQLSNREILSLINKSGGGVAFADNSVKVKIQKRNHSYDGENISESEMFNRMNKS